MLPDRDGVPDEYFWMLKPEKLGKSVCLESLCWDGNAYLLSSDAGG